MSAVAAAGTKAGDTKAGDTKAGGGKRKLVLLAVPALLAALGAGLWFSGLLPRLLHHKKPTPGHPADRPTRQQAAAPLIFVDMPEMIANLNSDRRASFIKLHARLELASAADKPAVAAAMPRLLDLFQTYLRDMRPDELRGSGGTWRLREELIARANIAAAPARITDVLFTEMLIQ